MGNNGQRIGDIASATGLTIRTLHYYEEIGLLRPSGRTDRGHRLFGPEAVQRLYEISLLRQFGLPLKDIATTLDGDQVDVHALMTQHLTVVKNRLETERRLHDRLARLVGSLHDNDDATADLLCVLEDMTMLETTINRRIAILVYADIAAASAYLTRVYGFAPGTLTTDGEGTVVHGEIHAGDGEFWLHNESVEFALQAPRRLGGASATMAVMVDDVDAHHRHAVNEGAEILYAPVDQAYGFREYSAVDPEGHLWSFMRPLE